MMTTNQFKRDEYRTRLRNMKNVVDPRYLLESLGFEIDRETPREFRCECRIHGGDNKTGFRFNKESKTWRCFTRHCEEIYGTDVIALIQAKTGVDFVGAVNYLKELVGDVDDMGFKSLQYQMRREKEEFEHRYGKHEVSDSIVTEECLRQFLPFRSSYFLMEGILRETLDYFEVAGGFTDNHGFIRDIIPIRDVDGVLKAYSMRDIRKNTSYDRKYILTTGFNKDGVLYNLNKAKKYGESKFLIIVEGFKAVWKLFDCGIPNVVACMGSKITPGQQNLLLSHALKGVVIMMDCDSAGVGGMVSAYKDLKDKIEIIPIFITQENADPADLSCEELHSYLEDYI
jgi:5S rRNA maturation endonuclease (ribonuclease M5)